MVYFKDGSSNYWKPELTVQLDLYESNLSRTSECGISKGDSAAIKALSKITFTLSVRLQHAPTPRYAPTKYTPTKYAPTPWVHIY